MTTNNQPPQPLTREQRLRIENAIINASRLYDYAILRRMTDAQLRETWERYRKHI